MAREATGTGGSKTDATTATGSDQPQFAAGGHAGVEPGIAYYVDQQIKDVRHEMQMMEKDLTREIERHSVSIEAKLSALSTELSSRLGKLAGRGTIWTAVGTVAGIAVATIIGAWALWTGAFSSGADSVSGSADRAADARAGVERLTQISEQQQEQLSRQQDQLDRIVGILERQRENQE